MGKQTEAVMRIDMPKVMKLVNGRLSLEYKFPSFYICEVLALW